MQGMVMQMNDEQFLTLAQLQAFLDGTLAVDFSVLPAERHSIIARTVHRFGYPRLRRAQKAVVLRFLERVSGYSRQQLTRLVKRGVERTALRKRYRGSRTSFNALYTVADVLLLAHTDSLHGDALRACHQEAHGARLEPVRRCALRAPGRHFRGPPV
jgi:hypothetical protein